MRKLLCVTFVFVFSVLSFAETYKVFLVLPMTGKDSSIGKDVKDGLNSFLEYMDSVNAFDSYKILFEIIDNGSSDLKDSFISYILKHYDKALMFLGGVYEKEITYLIDFCEKEKIPYLFPISVGFKNKIKKYFFPVIPSTYTGLVFLKNYFSEKGLSYKVVYDDKTKDNAFLIFEPTVLVKYDSKNIMLNENTLIYLSSPDEIVSFLKRFKGKTTFFFNHPDVSLLDEKKNRNVFNNSFFITWIKPDSDPAVSFFIKEFEKAYHKKPNVYNLIGWSIGDIVYELVENSYRKRGVTRENIVSELESFGENDGYDSTLFKVYFSDFAGYVSRIGISGFYFLHFINNELRISSGFYRLYELRNEKENEKR